MNATLAIAIEVKDDVTEIFFIHWFYFFRMPTWICVVNHVISVNMFYGINARSAFQEGFLEHLLHRALTALQEPIPVLVRQVVHHVR